MLGRNNKIQIHPDDICSALPDLNDLAYFVQVVAHGGFSAAERVLGISKSQLSRRLSGLETRLGVRLLQRSTRRFGLTEAGELFLKHCRATLAEAQTGIEAISQLQIVPRGTVRISCLPNASRVLLAPVLPAFLKRYPDVRVEVEVTNRTVDLYEDGIDIALRIRSDINEANDVIVRRLWRGSMQLVAAPALIKQYTMPVALEDLHRLPTLDRTAKQGQHTWNLVAPDGRPHEFAHQPRLVSDDLETLRQAAVAGVGIAKLSELMCGADLAAGRLLPLLSEWKVPEHQLYAVFLSRRGLIPAVRYFLDYLAEAFHQAPDTPD